MDFEGEENEVVQEYIRTYSLNSDLPSRYKKQALFLLESTRGLRRLKFSDRNAAISGLLKVERWLGEGKVFYPTEHEGFHALLNHVTDALCKIRVQIDEKYPDEKSS